MIKRINSKGQTIENGSIWFVESHACKWTPEESWIFELQLNDDGSFHTLSYVNWKRRGKGTSSAFGVDELDVTKEIGCGGPRLATEEEIAYFRKRTNKGGK